MGNLLGDLRYALRSLARQPTYTAVALLTLVLGIGTNTAIFSVIKAVLLNPLPYDDPSRLVVLSERNPDGNADLVAPLTFGDWKEQSHSVAGMAAFRQLRYAFAGRRRTARRPERPRDAQSLYGAAVQGHARPNVRARGRCHGRRPRGHSQPIVLGATLRWCAERHWPHDSARRAAVHRRRRHGYQLRLSAERRRRHLDASGLRSRRSARTLPQGPFTERRRAARRRRERGRRATRDDAHRRTTGHDLSRQQRRLGRCASLRRRRSS